MKIYKGRYSLITEDGFDKTMEVFDFDSGSKDFVSLKEAEKTKVSIATIDSLTTCFSDIYDLYSYLNKENIKDKETFSKQVIISYKNKSTGVRDFLIPVFDDEILHEISSHAVASSIDFKNPTTKSVFINMYNELNDRNSQFSQFVLKSTSNTMALNSYNRELIGRIDLLKNSNNNNGFLFRKMSSSFVSYREFRALYLSYIRYLDSLKRELPFTLIKK